MFWIDAKVLPKLDVLKRSKNGSKDPGIEFYVVLIGETIYDTPLHGYTTESDILRSTEYVRGSTFGFYLEFGGETSI